MFNYTVVAYMSNGYDSCRGCEVARWSSDFEMNLVESRKVAINLASRYLLTNKTIDYGEWEVSILVNGDPNTDLGYKMIKRASEMAENKLIAEKQAKAEKEKERLRIAEQDKRMQAEANRLHQIAAEKELFEKLKKKYEPTGETL